MKEETIEKLRRLAACPSATPGERAAARARLTEQGVTAARDTTSKSDTSNYVEFCELCVRMMSLCRAREGTAWSKQFANDTVKAIATLNAAVLTARQASGEQRAALAKIRRFLWQAASPPPASPPPPKPQPPNLRKLARRVWGGAHAERTVPFMELTGLRPSKARFWRTSDGSPPRLDGFAHMLVWRDQKKQFFLTVEPYWWEHPGSMHEIALQTCKRLGYRAVLLPLGFGLWAPPHTRLIIVAPSKSTADIEAIARLLRSTVR